MMGRRTFLALTGGALMCSRRAFCAEADSSPEMARLVLSAPTQQRVLDGSLRAGVFMDTGTGKPESGMFGNTRKYADGSPRFHEGIDIAPVQPWRRDSDPTDCVRAVAPGRVVYINYCSRNPSLYGNYIVLTHKVQAFGTIYTLYAHLRRIDPALTAGQCVPSGHPLGIMGHTPDFPLARAHLHFEIGIILNRYYPLIDPQHGIWNGANLYGIDPCVAFAEQRTRGFFDIASYIKSRPIAWGAFIPPGELPDYFKRYPSLWHGEHQSAQPSWIAFSYEGIPVSGRSLAPGEKVPAHLLGSTEELRKGRNWADPKRGHALLENLTVSPANPPADPQRLKEVGSLSSRRTPCAFC